MPVVALKPGYGGIVRDRQEDFKGVQMVFVLWERHVLIATPIALALSPDTRFGDLIQTSLEQSVFAKHPDWKGVDWSKVEWLLSGEPFTPDENKTLAQLGIGHKAFLTLRTPGSNGMGGSGI
jgi:phenol hydroxylase P4 protein